MRRILHDARLSVQLPAVPLVEAAGAMVLLETPQPSHAEPNGRLVQLVGDAGPPPAGQHVEAVQPLPSDARDADDLVVALADENRPRERLPALEDSIVGVGLVTVDVAQGREGRRALHVEMTLRFAATRFPDHALWIFTAVPYAKISAHCPPISEGSKRIR